MNSGKLKSWRKNKQKEKMTNPELWDLSGKKFETPRCKKITWKQDFETYQKRFWDFKIKPKFSEIHIFLFWTYHFFGGEGGGGGLLGGLCWGVPPKTKTMFLPTDLPTPNKGKSGRDTKGCEILLLLKLLVTPTLTPDIFHHFPPHPF